MSRVAIVTIAATNYLAHVRVLAASVREYHPEVDFIAVLAADKHTIPTGERFNCLLAEDVGVSDVRGRLFVNPARGFLTSIKAEVILHLLREAYDAVLYLDADMQLLGSIHDVLDLVGSHSLTLTPHLKWPAPSGVPCTQRDLLLTGIYNGGFIGATAAEETFGFLQWWSERLQSHCLCDLEQGLHFDQRWLDLAPGFIGNLGIIRDPGINTSYWNMQELDSAQQSEAASVCRLYHFSGYDPLHSQRLTSYHPELQVSDHPLAASLYPAYLRKLKQSGLEETWHQQWPWAHFNNGKPITLRHRRRYLQAKADGVHFVNPFEARGFLRWLNGPASIPFRCRRRLRRWFGF